MIVNPISFYFNLLQVNLIQFFLQTAKDQFLSLFLAFDENLTNILKIRIKIFMHLFVKENCFKLHGNLTVNNFPGKHQNYQEFTNSDYDVSYNT